MMTWHILKHSAYLQTHGRAGPCMVKWLLSASAGKPSQQLVDYHAYFYFHELIVLHNAIKDGRLEYVRIFLFS